MVVGRPRGSPIEVSIRFDGGSPKTSIAAYDSRSRRASSRSVSCERLRRCGQRVQPAQLGHDAARELPVAVHEAPDDPLQRDRQREQQQGDDATGDHGAERGVGGQVDGADDGHEHRADHRRHQGLDQRPADDGLDLVEPVAQQRGDQAAEHRRHDQQSHQLPGQEGPAATRAGTSTSRIRTPMPPTMASRTSRTANRSSRSRRTQVAEHQDGDGRRRRGQQRGRRDGDQTLEPGRLGIQLLRDGDDPDGVARERYGETAAPRPRDGCAAIPRASRRRAPPAAARRARRHRPPRRRRAARCPVSPRGRSRPARAARRSAPPVARAAAARKAHAAAVRDRCQNTNEAATQQQRGHRQREEVAGDRVGHRVARQWHLDRDVQGAAPRSARAGPGR